MHYFVNDPNADTINRVRGGVAEVKNIMVENIEKVHMCFSVPDCVDVLITLCTATKSCELQTYGCYALWMIAVCTVQHQLCTASIASGCMHEQNNRAHLLCVTCLVVVANTLRRAQ